MSEIVKVRKVSKHFGEFAALDNVSFNISQGSIVGLIGPNGAGKTTALKSILGLTGFDGEMSVLGEDPRSGRHKIMKRVCFIADVGVLPRWLRVSDAMDYIQGIHPRFNRDRAEFMLAETKIPKRNKVKELSKGMVTQLHLALVMAIEVDLLVLDEPTLGLDILFRKAFYERLLNDYFDNETSIIISTHQVEEIESLLTHLLFINGGRIVLDCPMDEVDEIYSEVLVPSNNLQRANALAPIHSRDMLGQKAMIFENVPKEELKNLGELHAPNVADLFVAKMHR
jgi:ABC-2 type transport system ATP-binding protein|tara:strand:- start:1929 stop:2777 length:849 start_codon:yes stop_codon:yes gene_type:complete